LCCRAGTAPWPCLLAGIWLPGAVLTVNGYCSCSWRSVFNLAGARRQCGASALVVWTVDVHGGYLYGYAFLALALSFFLCSERFRERKSLDRRACDPGCWR